MLPTHCSNQFCIYKNNLTGNSFVIAHLNDNTKPWFNVTQTWLEGHGLSWQVLQLTGFAHIEFPDPDVLVLFKLTFGGCLDGQ